MRIGVFGGTFDPVHLGHLILAEQCREQASLDQVWFVPAARPPHKEVTELTSFAHRVEMIQLAIAGQPAFRVNELERDRPGPSYTAVTMEEVSRKYPEHEWFLLLGADAVRDLPGWFHPDRIVAVAGLIVVGRPGVGLEVVEELNAKLGPIAQLQFVQSPLIEISSSDVRERVRLGRTVRYVVPRAVEAYIADKRLYV